MMASTIISRWIDDGSGEGIYRAELELDYGQLQYMDLINAPTIPPTPNVYVGETRLLEGVEGQISSDPKYGPGTILTTPESEATVPSKQKFEAIRDCLADKGMAGPDIDEAIGTAPGNKTLWEIKQSLAQWLRNHQ